MTKKLTIPVVLASIMALSLSSCRSEDLLNSSEELQQPSKFIVFTAPEEGSTNYGKGFKTLLERYDEIHNVQHTVKALRYAFKNSSEMADEYAELNIRSQDFTTKANEKFTLFPLIKSRKVDGIIIAVLKENDTQVEYLKMYPEAENYNKMLELFKAAYLKNVLQQRTTAKGNGGDCSSDDTPCDTGEVVITMPGVTIGIGSLPPGGGWVPPEGCGPYENCLNPGGGGGNDTPPTPLPGQDPCEKMKKENLKETHKNKVAELDKDSIFKRSYETGFVASYGPQTNYDPLANSDDDNLTMPIGNKFYGFMHTHLDKEGVIKIFSPADLGTFLTRCVRNAILLGSVDDAYAMVITSEGNYILKYAGDGNYGIGPNTITNWNKWYDKEYSELFKEGLVQAKVEKLFTKFLDEKVNIAGLKVYKSDKLTGKTSELNYRGDFPVKKTPCP